MVFTFVKKICSGFIVMLLLNGCLTIHNLNVVSDNSPPSTPVAYPVLPNGYDMQQQGQVLVPLDELGADHSKVPEPIDAMGNPVPREQSLISLKPEYIIHSGDKLDVKFFYHPELNDVVTVRPDGRISLQLVQDVQAASLTPKELTKLLKSQYRSRILDPDISIIVRSFDSNHVFVDGQVRNPGMVKMNDEMTIMQAVAKAKGLKDTARTGEVLLIRKNGLKRGFVYTIDLDAAMSGTDVAQNVSLMPYDIVYVPKSTISNINTWIDQYIRKNIPINVGMSFESIQFH